MHTSNKPTNLSQTKSSGLFLLVLLVLFLFVLLIGNILLSHEIRGLQKEYYKTHDQLLDARDQRGELMIEYSHLTSPARVEKIAKERLGMVNIQDHKQTVFIVEKDQKIE
ncbi:cell division protein FtsL [Thiomicrorhabdus sp. 6S2-11]|jgi:cell division protein FtsL|uniref:Cell division protein FtsL n=1 Tax=Thiomicrorhabdus marina TaxID=2818442 RepID=A0ABS3Q4H1_9GAMM|nr:cell division protein FtsL [Thiomicrorhabdus marina]MBO1927214.1 cell division protein FtsL [Thiomicrorhabdus marina]